ncbi:DNA polymerase III subunit epsilon [Corynebacterium sp. 35RC1]|nr:DNA polymerase III subunit epsilon [Corynebacterium sp. 35RC1]
MGRGHRKLHHLRLPEGHHLRGEPGTGLSKSAGYTCTMTNKQRNNRRRHRRPSQSAAPSPSRTDVASAPTQQGGQAPTRERRFADVETAPYAALSVQSTGIHPSTSRMVSIDIVTFTEAGEVVDTYHQVLNPGTNPGPFHLHGLQPEQIAKGKQFSQILRTVGKALDDRTLIVHNAPRAWGFVVAESRRAMSNAARQNRSRSRNRNRPRRRQRVGRVPTPAMIVDTLASARRQSVPFEDTRVRALAASFGLDAPPAQASVARASVPEAKTSREETLLIRDLFLAQRERGPLSEISPEELRGDRFHLQRSEIRVAALDAPRHFENPGIYTPELGLVQGMEVVIAPEVTMDPDDLIEAIMREGLAYSEKLTRKTSVVVCNKTEHLLGKAMHGQRKGIPLLSDTAFMEAVKNVAQGTPAPTT